MLRAAALSLLLAFLTFTRAYAGTDDRSVDLHAHLFMKDGMGWFFRGKFEGPLQATSWRDRFSSQANAETVEDSDIGVLVVALYAHPLLTWSTRESIRHQIGEANLFVATHPDWVLATSAAQARKAVAQGRRVMILSLEGASGILESEEDLEEFIDRDGIRIVTFLHITDDDLGGVAFMRSYHALSTPIRWFIELFHPSFSDGVEVNARGLTEKGRALAQALIRRKVWLDLSHSSDASQRELIPMIEAAGMPLLYTHGGLRRFEKAERGVSDEQLLETALSGGMIGLCPSEDVLYDTPVPPAHCNPGCGVPCDDGLSALAESYRVAAQFLGPEAVVLGSDTNGAIPHLPPSCGTGTTLDRSGLWNIGQTAELWRALRASGAPVPERLGSTVDAFIAKWARVTGP
jgi:microsomal dipeptidase-like Zn-dependent dipeptidase